MESETLIASNPFTEDYYLHGADLGISNYRDYRWLPDLTIPMAESFLRKVIGDRKKTVLEIGCARGYFIKALRFLDVQAFGYDISEWAIKNCHPDVSDFVSNDIPEGEFDWIYGKDVLEHMKTEDIREIFQILGAKAKAGMFFIVPLTVSDFGKYVYPNDELDCTHQQRLTMEGWMKLFTELSGNQFEVHGSYHVNGLKPASKDYPFSCGFFTMEKI